jgi:vacuolar-type H+-ATPase subunit H
MSEERAKRFVDKSFETGTDVEDAKDALSNSLAKAQKSYEDLIANAKKEDERRKLEIQKQGEQLRNDLYTKKTILNDFEVPETLRKKLMKFLQSLYMRIRNLEWFLQSFRSLKRNIRWNS